MRVERIRLRFLDPKFSTDECVYRVDSIAWILNRSIWKVLSPAVPGGVLFHWSRVRFLRSLAFFCASVACWCWFVLFGVLVVHRVEVVVLAGFVAFPSSGPALRLILLVILLQDPHVIDTGEKRCSPKILHRRGQTESWEWPSSR